MQTDASAMVAIITSISETRVPLADVERAPMQIKSRLYAKSLDKNHSLAMWKEKQKVKKQV
jgi:hypothetical protein